jgi:hypothetical protein
VGAYKSLNLKLHMFFLKLVKPFRRGLMGGFSLLIWYYNI